MKNKRLKKREREKMPSHKLRRRCNKLPHWTLALLLRSDLPPHFLLLIIPCSTVLKCCTPAGTGVDGVERGANEVAA